MPRECMRIIRVKSHCFIIHETRHLAKVSSNSSTPEISPDVDAFTTEVSELKNMIDKCRIHISVCTDKSKITRKQSKNRQARTRESVEYKAKAKKVKPQSKSAKKSQIQSHVAMVKAQIYVGFALNSLTKEAQAVTSRNDSLAILRLEGLEASPNGYK
ncbi:hypothetical protein Tco_0227319 [Tanacetum coccineum]